MIPVLFITHDRLAYTKKALPALMQSKDCSIWIFDNASTDGTREYLRSIRSDNVTVFLCPKNIGIRGAMNMFLIAFDDEPWVGKVDNDTVVQPDWAIKLKEQAEKLGLDVIQAKHPIIKATHPDGWDGWMANLEKLDDHTFRNSFVGGSGILIRRDAIGGTLPRTDNILGGWYEWQRDHPEAKKAFYDLVEIELLDAHGYGDYPEYYKMTGRI